ncbi:HEPN domain-containing protein [Paenibacillus piscarius]|uniref:HEPN domain-containing protein n=1 Tax=Paenibacillus piscarius TaxID=1089681 RepID=UPI001EE9A63B|nr:HEPN domain-containing protein [Paenibacillus piscarius]
MQDIIDAYVIERVELDKPEYFINEYISLSAVDDKKVLVSISKTEPGSVTYESNGYLFYHALQLGLPKLNIRISEPPRPYGRIAYGIVGKWNTPLFKYSSAVNDNIEEDNSSASITEQDIQNIIKFFEIYIAFSKASREKRFASEWKETRWSYALDQYTGACLSTTLESSNQALITGLEALLVTGEGNLQYKVSLNAALMLADSYEQRIGIMDLVKKMYNLRSKATHGEIAALVKLLNKSSVYDDYFELKRIFSQLLLLTYGKSEEDIFNRLDVVLLSGPSFSAP